MADISVLNTTVDLSGRTLVTAEGDRTITGLLSFNRGVGAAPFAVVAGAAKVANLDADLLDGQSGAYYAVAPTAWATYVPTWTCSGADNALGNGTLSGRYVQLGKLTFFDIYLAFGTTTTPGTGYWLFSLPSASAIGAGLSAHAARITDADAARRYGVVTELYSTTLLRLWDILSGNGVGGTVPITYAQSDTCAISGFYMEG